MVLVVHLWYEFLFRDIIDETATWKCAESIAPSCSSRTTSRIISPSTTSHEYKWCLIIPFLQVYHKSLKNVQLLAITVNLGVSSTIKASSPATVEQQFSWRRSAIVTWVRNDFVTRRQRKIVMLSIFLYGRCNSDVGCQMTADDCGLLYSDGFLYVYGCVLYYLRRSVYPTIVVYLFRDTLIWGRRRSRLIVLPWEWTHTAGTQPSRNWQHSKTKPCETQLGGATIVCSKIQWAW